MGVPSHPRRRVGWWLLSLFGVAGQLVALYRPSPPPALPGFPYVDKVGHLAMFAVPVCCLLMATRPDSDRLAPLGRWLIPAIFGVHAVISELIQYADYRRRSGDPVDVLADASGVLLGLLLAVGLIRLGRLVRRRQRERAQTDTQTDTRADAQVDARHDLTGTP